MVSVQQTFHFNFSDAPLIHLKPTGNRHKTDLLQKLAQLDMKMEKYINRQAT